VNTDHITLFGRHPPGGCADVTVAQLMAELGVCVPKLRKAVSPDHADLDITRATAVE
jgi:hypothetical protein